jgi:hypothetical protein
LPVSMVLITLIAAFFSFLFAWIRITFCRFRYDILIIISWKILLPAVLCLFMAFIPVILYKF